MTGDDWVMAKLPNGQPGYTLDLDGTDDTITILNRDVLNLGTHDFAVSFWATHDASSDDFVLNQRVDSENAFEIRSGSAEKFSLSVYVSNLTAINVVSGTALSAGWNHVVFSVDRDSATNTAIYLNGILVTFGTPTVSVTDASLAANIHLARWSGGAGYYWDGKLGDVRLYNRALSL